MQAELQRLENLQREHQRRMYTLELRVARQGTSAPPEVTIEIEDIQTELARIADSLAALQTTARSTLPPPPPIPAQTTPSAAELRSLRLRASAAYFAPKRWAEAERLLAHLVATDPSDAEVRERLRFLMRYREVAELRAADEWEAVLGALEELAHQYPGFADPDRHAAWAVAQQRRNAAYEAALVACDRADWAAAETALAPLLAEYPDDQDAAALLERVREELAKLQRRAEAEAARKRLEAERQRQAVKAAAQRAAAEAETTRKRLEAERQRQTVKAAAQRAAAEAETTRKRLEAERQRQTVEAAAQKAAAERQRQAAEARAQMIDPIKINLIKRQYVGALGQLTTVLKVMPKDAEALALGAGLIENVAVPLAERLRAGDLAGQYGDPRAGAVRFPPAMVKFAGGSFQIGNTQTEYQAIIAAEKQNEQETGTRNWHKKTVNQQSITIRAFELARYPVTNGQWSKFIAAGGYRPDEPWWDAAGRDWQKRNRKHQPSYWGDARFGKQHPNYPIVGINWYEAVAFCRWLTQYLNDGYTYLLPSELEWEYACRGVARRIYAWGDQPPDGERANFVQTHQGTTTVGCFPTGTTPEGLFDMTGNVWEWSRSEYRDYPYNASDGREDGQNPDRKRFTLRGGSWRNQSLYLRSSYRINHAPTHHLNDTGFRLARHRKV